MDRLITGVHTIIESTDADADRAFLRDVLGFDSVDAGEGWLIFALPPAELAIDPGTSKRHELYLMCADLEAVLDELKRRGARIDAHVRVQPWGRMASMTLPGGGELSIYEPRHPIPAHD